MKRILMIFAAMAAVLSSCTKNEIEPVLGNEDKDIVLNISVSDPGADTKALIKTGWVAKDSIKIWFDSNAGDTPDLTIKYDGSEWKQDGAINVTPNASGSIKAVYSNNVIVASKDNYTYDGTTLTFSIANWKFLTEIQVVVTGLTSASADKYTLACDKFTPIAGNGYTVGAEAITVAKGTNASAVTGISNTDGVAFVFATAEYSTTTADYKFALTDNTSSPAVTKVYTANTSKINGTAGSMTAIKALTIASTKFAALYVEIAADYDNDPSTPNTTLKWYRQNLAISDSGKKVWKGGNTGDKPEVKVPGTNENVIVGDYFQWAAHAGYCGNSSVGDKDLLIYNSFINTKCVGDTGSDNFDFKSAGGSDKYRFNTSNTSGYKGISPYYSSGYQYYKDASHSTLSRETTYSCYNDDVANIILGDNWRMPTTTEFQAMRKVTYWAWDATDCGYYVFKPGEGTSGAANDRGNFNTSTDDKSKALLFFPAAGYGLSTSLKSAGSRGRYWSSSLCSSPSNAYGVSFDSDGVDPQSGSIRYYGYSVRPVSD